MIHSLRIWALAWALGGLLVGLLLATGEAGHIPRVALPPLLAAAGALGGLLAALLFSALRRALPDLPLVSLALATISGALVGLALSRFGLGTPTTPSLLAGAVLGLVSGLIERRASGDASP